MPLTREFLHDLSLPDAAAERILSAHAEAVDALRRDLAEAQSRADALPALTRERDALLAQVADLTARTDDAQRIQFAFDAYRAQVASDRLAAARQSTLRAALLAEGANPQTVDLLAAAVTAPDDAWDGDRLLDPAAAFAPVRERYAALFARPVPLPTPALAPPDGERGPLTRDDVGRMSEQEILANWGAVQSALGRG